MLKPVKKKVGIGKVKVDFKLEFHASRVPQRGWDKLLVSLVPLETSKITCKTGKASVRNGSCQWPDPVYESAKISLDSRAKDIDKGIYKIVISTGSSRFGLLGETTIKLSEHIGATVPTCLTLPLQNCTAGTILHVKIQCLTPNVPRRDSEDQREASAELDLNSIDLNEHTENESVSPGNRITDFSQHQGTGKQASVAGLKVDCSASSVLQYCSEYLEVSSSPKGSEGSGYGRDFPCGEPLSPSSSVDSCNGKQESIGGLTDFSGFSRTGSVLDSSSALSSPVACVKHQKSSETSFLDHVLTCLDDSNARHGKQLNAPTFPKQFLQVNSSSGSLPLDSESSTPSIKHNRNDSLNTDLEATGTTFEYDEKKISCEVNAWILGNEIEKLNQQLAAEAKHGTAVEMELSILRTERDTMKLELEQLKSRKLAYIEKEPCQDKEWLQVENLKNTIKEVHDKLASEKSVNTSLTLQLKKIREFCSELLLDIQNLVNSLQAKNQEIKGFKFETQLVENGKQREFSEYHKITSLKKLQDGGGETQKLGRNIVSISESEGNGTSGQDEELSKMVEKLEIEFNKLTWDLNNITKENLDLNSQLKQVHCKLDTKDQLIAELQSEVNILSEQSLRSACEAKVNANKLREMGNDLEKLRLAEECSQSQLITSRTILDDLNSSVMALRSKNVHLEIQLKCSEEKASSLMKELDAMKNEVDNHEKEKSLMLSQKGQLKALRERADKMDKDYARVLKQYEDSAALNATKEEERVCVINSLEQHLKDAEAKASMANEGFTKSLEVISNLHAENNKLGEQMSKLIAAKEVSEIAVSNLQKMNAELQKRLQPAKLNCINAFPQVHDGKVGQDLEQLVASGGKVSDLENEGSQHKTIMELENRVQFEEEERRLNSSYIKDLKVQLSSLEEDDFSDESWLAVDIEIQKLQLQNAKLTKQLNMAHEGNRMTKENVDVLIEDAEILNFNIESHAERERLMENKVPDTEIGVMFYQSQTKSVREENLQLNEKDGVHGLQNALSTAMKGDEGYKRIIQDPWVFVESMKSLIASKEISHFVLKDQLQKVIGDYSASDVLIGFLESELSRLQRENAQRECLSCEVNSGIVSDGEHTMRTGISEEMLNKRHLEKSLAMECLKTEIQKLVLHTSSNADDNERLATLILSQDSIVQAQQRQDDEEPWNIQEIVKFANADSSYFAEEFEFREGEDMEQKLLEKKKRLEETLSGLNPVRKEETDFDQRVAVLQCKCIQLEEENQNLAKERDELIKKVMQLQKLQVEFSECRNAVHAIKLEKIEVEHSLERMNLDNSRLIQQLTNLREGFTVEQKNELMRLHKETGELKHKLSEDETEKEGLRKKVLSLENALQQMAVALNAAEKKLKEKEREESVRPSNVSSHVSQIARSLSRANSKVGPMSNTCPSRAAREIADLREKAKFLEDELRTKAIEIEALKQQLREKEKNLCSKIEHLELLNQQLVEEHSISNINQMQKELNRLHDQNAALFQREKELLSSLHSPRESELETLKEEKKKLENALSKFNEGAGNGSILKSAATLETELAEALEANNMYKAQLQSAFAKQHHVHAAALENLGSIDQVLKDLSELKKKNSFLDGELKEMRERYFRMSLQFAEVEAQREELVMTVRNLRNGRRMNKCKSYS